tara:strand:- start:56 stop:487 length:432 start_codon:yes stop_codon:yes gene_type:complete
MSAATSETEKSDNDDATLLKNALRCVLVPYDNDESSTPVMCRLFSPYRLPQEAVKLEDWSLVDNLPVPGDPTTSAAVGATIEYRNQKVRTDICMVEPGTASILKLAIFQWDVESESGRIAGMRLHPRSDSETAFLRGLPKIAK